MPRPDLMRYTSTRPTDRGPAGGSGARSSTAPTTASAASPSTSPGPRAPTLLQAPRSRTSDVLLENFTPRVMENFGLGWDARARRQPAPRSWSACPAYGLDGPWRDRTGFAQTMEAITGMAWVTGWPDGPPVLPRGACDPLAALHAVFATMLALRDRETSGEGRLIEVTMVEAALNMAAEQVVEYGASGTVLARTGQPGPGAAPQNLYACAGDEEWLALAVDDRRAVAARCATCSAIPEWACDPRLATVTGRRAAHDADRRRARPPRCAAPRRAATRRATLSARGVPAAHVVDARDIADNPQMQHRGLLRGRGPPGHRPPPDPGAAVPVPAAGPGPGSGAPRPRWGSTTTRSSAACSASPTTSSRRSTRPASSASGRCGA